MNIIINNIAFISLIISLINITMSLYNWYNSRPRLIFYPTDNMKSGYKETTPSEFYYKNSHCIVFYYVKIANNSSHPCTISEFVLYSDNYDSSVSSSRVEIRERYTLNSNSGIFGKHCIQLPVTIPPFGYLEGFVVFPYGPLYSQDTVNIDVEVRTSRKTFHMYDTLTRYPTEF